MWCFENKLIPWTIENGSSRHCASSKLVARGGLCSWSMSCKKYFCILTFLSPPPLVLLSLAADRFDVPLYCRVMSAVLLGTPAELRTMLPQEGKKVETYPFCECIQVCVHVYPSIVCVHVYTCATLETDTRHGFQLTVKEAACFRCFLNSLTILVPHFSSITFNVSNQRVWTREWKPSFYEDNTLHCALHGLYFISRNTHTWWSVFDLKEIVQSKMKMLFLHDFLSWNTKG